MAAGKFTLYNSALLGIINGSIDLDDSPVTAVLVDTSYIPASNHEKFSDVSGHEVIDADYKQVQVTGMSITESSGVVTCDSDMIDYGNPVTIEAKHCILVAGTASSLTADSKLIGHGDLDTSDASAMLKSTNSEFKIDTPHGLFTVSAAS